MKGCPLRCSWCHNPEGLLSESHIIHRMDVDRIVGKWYTSKELDCVIETIDALLNLTSRYVSKARQSGSEDIAEILENVPANPPRSFHEALQFLRLAYAVPWFIGQHQIGLGRFDQYM